MSRYFIRDCVGQLVGNPAGYKTIRAALAQQNNPRSPAARALRAAYDARERWYDASHCPAPFRANSFSSVREASE